MPQGRRRGSRTSQLSPRSRAAAELKEKLEVIRLGMKGALKVLTPAELSQAAAAMTKTVHPPDAVIFKQGDMQTAALVILDGYADVKRVLQSTGEERKITQLDPGETFGESVLLRPAIQESALVAAGWCVVLELEHVKYAELFGDRREAVQQLLDENAEKMRLIAIESRRAEDEAHERTRRYNLEHQSRAQLSGEAREAAAAAAMALADFKPSPFTPDHPHAMELRLGAAHFIPKETSRPAYRPGQRVIYRTRLFTHGQGQGQEVAGNVGGIEDGGRSSKRGVFHYRVWFRHENVVYEELKMEPELEDADVNRKRKMLNFVLKLLQTRRFAGFDKWRRSTAAWRQEARLDTMATRIQTAYRRYSGRLAVIAIQKSRLQMGRLRRKQRRLDALAARERAREEWELKFAREAGYSLDGVRFFKTSKALRDWCDRAAQVVASWERLLHRDDGDKRRRALRRWRNNVLKLRFAEANRVVHPLPSYAEAQAAAAAAGPLPQVVANTFSPSQWHPALGLRLPPLPIFTGSEAMLTGEVRITDVKRFQHFKKALAGPLDCGNWLIPPRVLIGGFPWGQARRRMGVKSRGDCISVLLLKSVTVFVCLMPDEELEEAKQRHAFELEAELAKKHGYLLGEMKQGLENAKANLDRAMEMFEKTMGYAEDYRRPYVAKKEKMEIIYNSQKKRWDAFPKVVKLLKLPMPANPNVTVPDEALLGFLPKLEQLLRDGCSMYIFSYHGHGRVGIVGGCLLGRLYGLHTNDVLARIQRYHDTRPGLKEEAAERAAEWQKLANKHLRGGELPAPNKRDQVVKAAVAPSCPYNSLQAEQIRRVLELSESQYHGISKTTRLGAFQEDVTRRERAKGVPQRLRDGLGLHIVRVPRTDKSL